MAFIDILGQSGDGQDFIVEIPAGNSGYTPADILLGSGGAFLCSEIPIVVPGSGGGGDIFIMSE
jgi:hypothetical protein